MRTRAFWMACCTGFFAVLVLARVLSPNANGVGTHTQLGLPRCAFLALTSLPCPACGLTTSFAFMARGELEHALHANAFGVLLFALVALGLPACAWAALRSLSPRDTYIRLRLDRVALVLAAFAFVHWVARVAVLLNA